MTVRALIVVACLFITSALHAQHIQTTGTCSPGITAEHGASVVFHCVTATKQQLQAAEQRNAALERDAQATRAGLVQINQNLDDLHAQVSALGPERADAQRIRDLNARIAVKEQDAKDLQDRIAAQQQSMADVQRVELTLQAQLDRYRMMLRVIDKARYRPNDYQWVGMGTAVIGTALFATFGGLSSAKRSDLESRLSRAPPEITQAAAGRKASTIRTFNAIADISLLVAIVGAAVGSTFLVNMFGGQAVEFDKNVKARDEHRHGEL